MAGVTCYVYHDVYANVIAKAGRNEVQLGSVLSSGLLEPPNHRFELAGDEAVIAAVWTDLAPAAITSKKRKLGLPLPSAPSNTVPMLWTVLLSGQSRVFSPLPIDIDTPKFTAIARGTNSVWGSTDSQLVEYTLSGATGATIATGGAATVLEGLALTLKKNPAQLFCAVDGDDVSVYKSTRKKPAATFLLEFAPTYVAQLARKTTLVFADASHVEARDTDTHNHATYDVSALLNISSIAAINRGGYDFLFVCGDEGILGFRLDFVDLTTNEKPQWVFTTSRPVHSVYSYNDNAIKAVVYRGIDPELVEVLWSPDTPGKFELAVPNDDTTVVEDKRAPAPLLIELPEANGTADDHDITPQQLYSRLIAALGQEPQELVAICASCSDDTVIKDTVKRFRPVPTLLVDAVADDVALDPLLLLSLLAWLKWILLLHGGALAKKPAMVPTLQRLQSGLDDGMKVLSHLLALQGRLQLLNCQGQLREDGDDDDDDDDANVVVSVPTADIEYANGEAE